MGGFLLQLLPDGQQHGDVAGPAADEVGNRLGQENPRYPQTEHPGQDKGQGHDDKRFPQQGEEYRLFGAPQRHGGGLARHLPGHHEKAKEIDVHRGDAGGHQLRLVVEQVDEPLRKQQQAEPDGGEHRNGGDGHKPNARLNPAILPRAVVVPHHRLGGAGQPADRYGGNLPDRVDNGHDPHIKVAAEPLEGGVADHLDAAVGDCHKEPGGAQGGNLPHQGGLNPHGGGAEPDFRPFSTEEGNRPHRGNALGDYRCQSRSPDAPVEDEDKEGVQGNVDHRPQQDGQHPGAPKALGVDKAVHPQAGHGEDAAADVNGNILVGVGESDIAGPKQIEEGTLED